MLGYKEPRACWYRQEELCSWDAEVHLHRRLFLGSVANKRGFALRLAHLQGVGVAMGVETPRTIRRPKRCVIGGVCMSVETGTGLLRPRTT